MIQLGGIMIAVLFTSLMLFNGLMMVISPIRWMRLPGYIGFHGTLRRVSVSSVSGRLKIRGCGLVLTALMTWTIAGFLAHEGGSSRRLFDLGSPTSYKILYVVTCLGVGVSGLVMALRPAWWFRKFIESEMPQAFAINRSTSSQRIVERVLRGLGIALLCAALYIGLQYFV